MADDETSLFEGTGGAKECTEFIRSVRAHAFSQGKIRDDDWMADYASTRMTGDAVIWFEGLEEETQASWKLLRKALIDQYTAASTADIPNSTIPTPAAAAPVLNRAQESPAGNSTSLFPTPTAAASGPSHISSPSLGRVSPGADVIATGSEPPTKSNQTPSPSNVLVSPKSHSTTTVGVLTCLLANRQSTDLYISRNYGLDPARRALLRTTRSRADALRVSYVTSTAGLSGSADTKHLAVEATEYRLGVVWNNRTPNYERDSESYAGLTAAKTESKSISPQDRLFPLAKWDGELHIGVWHIAENGEVTAVLRRDDDSKDAHRLSDSIHFGTHLTLPLERCTLWILASFQYHSLFPPATKFIFVPIMMGFTRHGRDSFGLTIGVASCSSPFDPARGPLTPAIIALAYDRLPCTWLPMLANSSILKPC